MTLTSDTIASENTVPMYARFTPRFRAMLLDALVLAAMFYGGALTVHSITDSNEVRRALFGGLILSILLYEPFLVAIAGGTLGHRFMNLRVVDNRTNGNLGLAKALTRMVIKDLLGWLSFMTMTVANRHQALHDIFTKSTVQVRDASKAYAHHFVPERDPDNQRGTPSKLRRITVILIYMFFSYLLLSFGLLLFLSSACLSNGRCSSVEVISSNAEVMLWLALCVLFVTRGWRGNLYGCRKSSDSEATS